MSRLAPVLTGLLLLSPALTRAADAPAGSWKMSIPGSNLTFLFALEEKGGKWSGSYLGTSVPNFPKVTVADVAVSADSLRVSLKFQGQELSFDGKLPPDAKTGRVAGSLKLPGAQMILVHLEPSKLKSFDKYEFNRETLEQSTDSQALADAAVDVLKQAGEKKLKVEEVRGWADKTLKSADGYGLRWQRSVATRLAQALASNKDYSAVAVEYARKAERLLDENDEPSVQMDVLATVAQVLTQAGKADEAKQIMARMSKLEEKDLAEYAKKAPFKPTAFEGRKGKSERVVLVELFTGAECPPCVAADVAFDALEKTYKPSDVVLLQYHVHIPRPDPLTNPDTMTRLQYYGKKIEGTPTAFFNGKPAEGGGGPMAAARKSYTEFCSVIEPLLEKNADAKIQLAAERKGDEIAIKASVPEIGKTGENVRLRLVIVEDHVRYTGGNGLRYHHCVVRSFPGGVKGVAVTKKGTEQTATVKLDDLRGKLNDYLDEYEKNEGEFPRADRPLNLKGLRVVAFVQDDDSNEVLQAAQVEIKE